MAVRRGQFFLLGALVLVGMMAGIVLFEQGDGVTLPETQRTKALFDQSLQEFPAAVNRAAAGNASAEAVQRGLHPYLAFQSRVFTSHGLQNHAYALILLPADDKVEAVVANFGPSPINHTNVTVAGTLQQPGTLPSHRSTILTFDSVPARFTATIQFTGHRSFNATFRTTRERISAWYGLKLAGERQVWEDTAVY